MQPCAADKLSIDPRALLRRGGLGALEKALLGQGYVPQPQTLSDLGEALTAELPLLVEGPRGAGKTALPEALAAGCNLDLYYLQCMEGLTRDEILGAWDTTAQNQHVLQALHSGLSLAEAQADSWQRSFFRPGEVLAGYSAVSVTGQPHVVVVDEIDKLSETAEDMLLGLLGRGFAHIPRLQPTSIVGRPGGQPYPIVILTSNNMRSGVSGPLRSRCLFTFIAPPTPAEEVAILKANCPLAPDQLLAQVVKLLSYIRLMPNIAERNKPGLRESIALLGGLQRAAVLELNEPVITRFLTYLGKQESDRNSLLAARAALAQTARQPNAKLDAALRHGLAAYSAKLAAAGAGAGSGAEAGAASPEPAALALSQTG